MYLLFVQVLNLCLEELLFDGSVLQEDFTKAEHHLNKITELDHYSAQYRYIYIVLCNTGRQKDKSLLHTIKNGWGLVS